MFSHWSKYSLSDPVADGPDRRSRFAQFTKGTLLRPWLKPLKTIQTEIPLVIGWPTLTPSLSMVLRTLSKIWQIQRSSGLIIPDPPHEHANFVELFGRHRYRLDSPSKFDYRTWAPKIKLIKGAEGFVYAVAINGVTGNGEIGRADLDKHLAQLHRAKLTSQSWQALVCLGSGWCR